jgi:hypothetical protein
MQKNKTYFNLLTEVEQEQFKANLAKGLSFESYLNQGSESFKIFVQSAFVWRFRKKQTHEYWYEIANRNEVKLMLNYLLTKKSRKELTEIMGIGDRTLRYWIQGKAIPLTKQKFINRLFLNQAQTNSGNESHD